MAIEEIKEELEWSKLPISLQNQFIELAEKDSQDITARIEILYDKLSSLYKEISGYFKKFEESKEELAIGAVDGCKSLTPKENIGASCMVYTYGYIIMKGKKLNNNSRAGSKIYKQVGEEIARRALGLILTYVERKVALDLANECDYVVIDGSFYGYLYPMLRLKKQGYLSDKLQKLINDTFEITNKLIESKKVIGVVKRTRIRAIGGWYFLKYNDKSYCEIPDRLVLSYLMQPKSVFDYREILGDKPVQVYNEISLIANRKEEASNIMENAESKFEEAFSFLNLSPENAKKLRRIQVKSFPNTTTCEIEHPDLSFNDLLRLISSNSFFNKATGLPIALDIVDELVSFPNKLTSEYLMEIEAKTLNKLKGRNIPLELIKTFFSSLNPQK